MTVTVHVIEIDESRYDDIAYKAFCTSDCGWSGDWRHSTDYQDVEYPEDDPLHEYEYVDPAGAAFDAASGDGDDHLAEVRH